MNHNPAYIKYIKTVKIKNKTQLIWGKILNIGQKHSHRERHIKYEKNLNKSSKGKGTYHLKKK